MKALGFAVLAFLALAFLRGVAESPRAPRVDPAPVHDVSGAMARYVVDTPNDLRELEARRRELLRDQCRLGYVERGYCAALDKAE